MRSSVRKRADALYDLAERKYRVWEYRAAARRRQKTLGCGRDRLKEYRQDVLPYWRRFGVRPSPIWYRLFTASGGTADPRYIPDDIWFDRILPYYSNSRFRRAGEDKAYHGVWFPDERRPRTITAQIAGIFYNENYEIIPRKQAERLCVAQGSFVVKPTVDSGCGRLIRFYADADEEEIAAAFDLFGDNFIVQEIVEQHEVLRALHPDSLNTLRIVSFLYNNEVRILSAILRMGGKGARVDNIGAGGCACAVHADGTLGRYAINRRSERVETTADGVRFDSVTVPGFAEATAMVKRMHAKLAHFKLIGWDIAIDREGLPVMIEFNTAPAQNQYCCGPTFGDLTDEVLTDVFITKSLKNSQN